MAGAGGASDGSAASQQLADSLDSAARALGSLGRGVGDAGSRASDTFAERASSSSSEPLIPDEFEPSPQETERLVLSKYAVGRNLLVRFRDDPIDQSSGLARLCRTRFTDDVTGIGGRLDFKSLDGTHVTPNAPELGPYLAGLDPNLVESVGAGEAARALEQAGRERDEASEAVAAFAWREVKRAAES